jgi:hypothetical protein
MFVGDSSQIIYEVSLRECRSPAPTARDDKAMNEATPTQLLHRRDKAMKILSRLRRSDEQHERFCVDWKGGRRLEKNLVDPDPCDTNPCRRNLQQGIQVIRSVLGARDQKIGGTESSP